MTDDDFTKLFNTFERMAFRLETRPSYNVPEEAQDLEDYLSGTPFPRNPNREWLDFIRHSVARGKKFVRVRLVPEALTLYLRFEIEWGYFYSAAAGEEIRMILPVALADIPPTTLLDYWLFDNHTAVAMNYKEDGSYSGAHLIDQPGDVGRLCELRDELLKHSISLHEFVAAVRKGEYC